MARGGRSVAQQSALEARRLCLRKRRLGYAGPTPWDATWEVPDAPRPMLAHVFEAHRHKLPAEVLVQPKLDGVRAVVHARTGRMFSRRGVRLRAARPPMASAPDDAWLDGELYAHGLSFHDITSRVRRGLDVPFVAYDLIVPDAPYAVRLARLRGMEVEVVDTEATALGDVGRAHERWVALGYEGVVVRNPASVYAVGRRSPALLKVKRFLTEDFEVSDIVPAEREPAVGVAVLRLGDGRTFRAALKMPFADRVRALEDRERHRGAVAAVRFFERHPSGVPRFPVCLGFHPAEDRRAV